MTPATIPHKQRPVVPKMCCIITSLLLTIVVFFAGCTSEVNNIPGVSTVYTDKFVGVESNNAIIMPSLGGITVIHISNESGSYHVMARTTSRSGHAGIYYAYKTISITNDRFGQIITTGKACNYDTQTVNSDCLLGIADNYNTIDRIVNIPQNGIDFSIVVAFHDSSSIKMNVTKIIDNKEVLIFP